MLGEQIKLVEKIPPDVVELAVTCLNCGMHFLGISPRWTLQDSETLRTWMCGHGTCMEPLVEMEVSGYRTEADGWVRQPDAPATLLL